MTDAPRPVRVIWEDITVVDSGAWVDRDTISPAATMVFESLGWVLELTPERLVLTGCMGKTLMGPREVIPTGVIKSITELALGASIPIPSLQTKVRRATRV